MLHKENLLEIQERLGYNVVPLVGDLNSPISSVPLILPDDHGYDPRSNTVTKIEGKNRTKLFVVPEALALLEKITDPVSVIAIAGLARTGKSYIQSRLLGKADAFELGNTFNPKTFGIWMGTHILRGKNSKGENFSIILLDTEGIDAVSATGQQDACIFVLTILLCSKFIYNSLHVPYKNDLQKLECFTQLAQGVQVRQGEETNLGDNQYFPDFLWLLRDVTLKDFEDTNGITLSPTEYIKKKVLKRSSGLVQSPGDTTAQIILSLFPKLEAYTLPPPHGNVEFIQNIAKFHPHLNKDFRSGVDRLIEGLLVEAKSKQKSGFENASVVTGEILSIMTTNYVDAVNDPNTIPAMDDTWKNTIEVLTHKCIENLVVNYKQRMEDELNLATNNGATPLEEFATPGLEERKTVMGIHKLVYKPLLEELFRKVSHFGVSGADGKRNLQILKDRFMNKIVVTEENTGKIIGGEIMHFLNINRKISEKYCKELYLQLFKPIKKNMEENIAEFTFQDLVQHMENLIIDYDASAIGPEKMNVLQTMEKQVGDAYKEQFKRLKGYQDEAMKAVEERKQLELQNQAQMQQNEEIRNEMMMMHEENLAQQEQLQANFNAQLLQMKEEEMQRQADEQQKIIDLQDANFKQMSEMMAEITKNQDSTVSEIMEKMQNMQAQHNEDITKMLDAIKSIPPPEVKVSPKKGFLEKLGDMVVGFLPLAVTKKFGL